MNQDKHLVTLNSISTTFPTNGNPMDISNADVIGIQVDSMPISAEVVMHVLIKGKESKSSLLNHTQLLVMEREPDEIGLFFTLTVAPEERDVKFSVNLSTHPKQVG